MGEQVRTKHKRAVRFQSQQEGFEKSLADALEMEPREVQYYFERLRNDPVEGAQFNALKNLAIQLKMIYGEDYHEKIRAEREAYEAHIERERAFMEAQRRVKEKERERQRIGQDEQLAWDIQCDKILERVNELERPSDYTPLNSFERYVFTKLRDYNVLVIRGWFRKRLQAPEVKRDEDGDLQWPLPSYVTQQHTLWSHSRIRLGD